VPAARRTRTTSWPAPRQPEQDVAAHVEVWEQRALLRHVADPPLLRRDLDVAGGDCLAVEQHVSALRIEKARDDAQHRGLPASRCAQDRHDLAVGDLEIHAVEHAQASEAAAQPGDRYGAHGMTC
jgi:hypothetical protein